MKKIVNLFLATGVLFSMASCNLDQLPANGEVPENAYTMEYIDGLRADMYTTMAILNSGSFLLTPDLYADVYNGMANNGNQGYYSYNHRLTAQADESRNMWQSYYATMSKLNFAIEHFQDALQYGDLSTADQKKVNIYIGEVTFARAWTAHHTALLFCEDYCRTPEADKATADAAAKSQMGLPYRTEWDPKAPLMGRGTLYDFYQQVLADINVAKENLTTAGRQNSSYFTADAVTAFEAQIALHMHDFATAATKAASLYGKYPLVNSKEALVAMWTGTTSSENIVQITADLNSSFTIGSLRDILAATWEPADSRWVCTPLYAPEGWIVNLFATTDYRTGSYVTDISDTSFNFVVRNSGQTMEASKNPRMIVKFTGTTTLETAANTFSYATFPKMFRIADMYLIEAEALYRTGGAATTPLTTLATSRNATPEGADVFAQIQNERAREMIGEGGRLFDLKRWNKDIVRDYQQVLWDANFLNKQWFEISKTPVNQGYTFPISTDEMGLNPNMEQNPEFE